MNPEGRKPDSNDLRIFLSKDNYFSDYILNNSKSMISIINRDYVYEKVNENFCRAHKGVADSIIGKTLGDVWGKEEFIKNIKGNIDRCFEGATVRYEASFRTPQSGRRFFEVVFRPFQIGSGEITHLLAETYDITDLKLSEKIAIEKEEEFRRFETNLPIGFVRCNPEGEIIHANKAFMLIMECDDEKILNSRKLSDFYSDAGIFRLHHEQLTDGKPKSFGRVPLKTCHDTEIVCRISAFMRLDECGTPSYIDFSFEDSSRELMLENRLLQAQKLETIGALAGGIAHDFNNILTTITGYSEMLQEDLPESSQSFQQVAKIQIAVSKARSLINQMLTFSRQVEQEKVSVNVYDVLKETIGFIKAAAPYNVEIRNHIHSAEILVFADPTQLFRVFLNLLTNAVQSLEERRGVVTVSLSKINGRDIRDEVNKMIVADEYALITVQDTGKGMDKTLLRRIFEPFFTTREVGKGSGLGLSVVHGIVTEMGGDILVSSEKGKGSVFYVYLPVSSQSTKIPYEPGKHKRILFIMGNKHESRVLNLALESAGYEIAGTSDRTSLVKLLKDRNQEIDLIIYMCDSEKISLDDLLTALKDSESKIPCIFIDDPGHDLHEEKLVNSDIISQHLIKPVSLREIKSAIQLSIK